MNKIIMSLMVMLTGCATTPQVWNHPTKTAEDFERDKYECLKDGEQHAANYGFHANPFIIADRAKLCMKAKGYKLEEK